MIICEHWINDSEGYVSTLIPKNEPHADDLGYMCCQIFGENWDDCVSKYDVHMGFKDEVADLPGIDA